MASRSDVVSQAKKELSGGVNGRPNKYTRWYGMCDEWCAMFVSYVMNKAGVSTSISPKTASVSTFLSFARNKGRFKDKGSGYKPQAGDVMILKNGMSHTGIVISSTGSSFTTIEGNSGDKVAQRTYSLNYSHLTGFFVPNLSGGSSTKNSSSSGTTTTTTTTTTEKKELSSTKIVSVSGAEGIKKSLYNVENPNSGYYELYIKNSKVYQPIIIDGVSWETERTGSAGKLTFTVLKDSIISFNEGDTVTFKVNGDGVFYGYVFSKKRDKEHHIEVTAYDQLRYFTNQSTYIFKNKRADQMLQMIADDFKLTVGKLDNTKYTIPLQIEDNSSLFDIMLTAIDKTFSNTGKRFLLFDDYGSLQLKDIAEFKFSLMINNETVENFDYTSSIDDETYNKVVLYKDTDSGVREMYITQDGDNISRWGVLQYTDTYGEGENPTTKGKSLLSSYNKVTRKLSVSGALGDIRVRAGSQVFVSLNLGDLIMNTYMMVETATHNFENDNYTMDLTLIKIGSFTA